MAQYLLLIFGHEAHYEAMTDERNAEIMAGHEAFGQKYVDAIRGGNALQSPATATTVRTEDGLVTDGPWIESKEALGGYYVVEADDLDAAIAMARDIPTVGGGIEIRPIMVFS